ncbi:ATP-binding cassette domain-containing protein, partial [Acinetobacter baumannii]
NEFLLTQPQIVDQPQATKTELKGDIQFNNVSFTYQNTGINALKNINLHIKQGEKVLIMGKTGSGKSTLVQLLLRMFDVNEGEISVGSKN